MKPTTKQAYELFHDGVIALSEVERVGMRIDVELLDKTIEETAWEIKELSNRLRQDEVWRLWKRRWGNTASLGSRHQLGVVVFEELGHESSKKTAKGKQSVDAEALEAVDLLFVQDYLKLAELKIFLNTHLKGVRREVVDGYLHPSFNLHFARTFRSSCDSPNFQNIPIRVDYIAKRIRSCFIPRDSCVLVEIDCDALEFKVAGCHWKDEAMIVYGSDSSLDIHRDMAAECYLLGQEEVSKTTRFYAKNQCVFPLLYGSYYISCARKLWNVMIQEKFTVEGTDKTVKEHLANLGIDRLGNCNPKYDAEEGTFEKHIQGVEERFNERFPQWSERKEQWEKRYRKRGRFQMMTGFECAGIYSRNDLHNYPIQGPAFHLLLWSLIRIVSWLKKNKMKSRVVGQIHDSLVMDVAEEELDEVVAKVKQVMTEDVREAWDWVIVPLSVGVEVAETNWYEKKELFCD